MAKSAEPIQLPQVNPGNVALALEGVRTAAPRCPLEATWLNDFGINQPRQALGLLRFLELVDDANRLRPAVIEARAQRAAFRELLADRARNAYADAGCGTLSSLGWLGRDRLTNQEIRERITLRGPLARRDVKRGGARNAFYTLCALHELLLNGQVGGNSRAGQGAEAAAAPPPRQDPTADRGPPAGHASQEPVVAARMEDAPAARDFLRRTFQPQAPPSDPQGPRELVIPFAHRPGGELVVARIQVDPALAPGDLARLARVLQAMADAAADD